MINLHQQIADLEAEIDALTDAAEKCRKSMIIARIAIGAGGLLLVALLLGLIRHDPLILIGGIAAAVTGIAFYGSSKGSMEQLTEKIRASEARRAEMIDGMDLRTVEER